MRLFGVKYTFSALPSGWKRSQSFCIRGSAPYPAGGLTPPPKPPGGWLGCFAPSKHHVVVQYRRKMESPYFVFRLLGKYVLTLNNETDLRSFHRIPSDGMQTKWSNSLSIEQRYIMCNSMSCYQCGLAVSFTWHHADTHSDAPPSLNTPYL